MNNTLPSSTRVEPFETVEEWKHFMQVKETERTTRPGDLDPEGSDTPFETQEEWLDWYKSQVNTGHIVPGRRRKVEPNLSLFAPIVNQAIPAPRTHHKKFPIIAPHAGALFIGHRQTETGFQFITGPVGLGEKWLSLEEAMNHSARDFETYLASFLPPIYLPDTMVMDPTAQNMPGMTPMQNTPLPDISLQPLHSEDLMANVQQVLAMSQLPSQPSSLQPGLQPPFSEFVM